VKENFTNIKAEWGEEVREERRGEERRRRALSFSRPITQRRGDRDFLRPLFHSSSPPFPLFLYSSSAFLSSLLSSSTFFLGVDIKEKGKKRK
jgi:hypothetical protein